MKEFAQMNVKGKLSQGINVQNVKKRICIEIKMEIVLKFQYNAK